MAKYDLSKVDVLNIKTALYLLIDECNKKLPLTESEEWKKPLEDLKKNMETTYLHILQGEAEITEANS